MPRIHVLPDDIDLDIPEGASLKDACERAGASVPFGCGEGTCGTCIVATDTPDVLGPMSEGEHATLAIYGADDGKHRLTCQCRPTRDATIDLP